MSNIAQPTDTIIRTNNVADHFVPYDGIDPFFDDCDDWCENAANGHYGVVSTDTDRNHYSPEISVLLRSGATFRFADDAGGHDGIELDCARIYLQRNVRHREPTIWLGHGENAVGAFELTPAEAHAIGSALVELADQGVCQQRG